MICQLTQHMYMHMAYIYEPVHVCTIEATVLVFKKASPSPSLTSHIVVH